MKQFSGALATIALVAAFSQGARADEFMPGSVWNTNNPSDKDSNLVCKLRAAGSKALRAWVGVDKDNSEVQKSLARYANVFCLFKKGNPNSQVTMVIHPGSGDGFKQPSVSSAHSVFTLIKNYPVNCNGATKMYDLVDIFEIGNEVAQDGYWGKTAPTKTDEGERRIANYVTNFLQPANDIFGAEKLSTYGANWAGNKTGYSFSIIEQLSYLESRGAMKLVNWVGLHIYSKDHVSAISYAKNTLKKKVVVTEWSAKMAAGDNKTVFQRMMDSGADVTHYFTPTVVYTDKDHKYISSASNGAMYDNSGSFNALPGGWAAEFANENIHDAGIKPANCGSSSVSSTPPTTTTPPPTTTPPTTTPPTTGGSKVSLTGNVVDSSGKGLPNLTVYLDKDNDHVVDSGEVSVKTDSSGKFTLSVDSSLVSTSYRVRVLVPSGYTQVTPSQNYGYDPSKTKTGEKFVLKK